MTINQNQYLYVSVNVFMQQSGTFPAHLTFSAPNILPNGITAWYINGPLAVSNFGCIFGFVFGTDSAGFAGGTIKATVQAVLYASGQSA